MFTIPRTAAYGPPLPPTSMILASEHGPRATTGAWWSASFTPNAEPLHCIPEWTWAEYDSSDSLEIPPVLANTPSLFREDEGRADRAAGLSLPPSERVLLTQQQGSIAALHLDQATYVWVGVFLTANRGGISFPVLDVLFKPSEQLQVGSIVAIQEKRGSILSTGVLTEVCWLEQEWIGFTVARKDSPAFPSLFDPHEQRSCILVAPIVWCHLEEPLRRLHVRYSNILPSFIGSIFNTQERVSYSGPKMGDPEWPDIAHLHNIATRLAVTEHRARQRQWRASARRAQFREQRQASVDKRQAERRVETPSATSLNGHRMRQPGLQAHTRSAKDSSNDDTSRASITSSAASMLGRSFRSLFGRRRYNRPA